MPYGSGQQKEIKQVSIEGALGINEICVKKICFLFKFS
jgi:hypothetical protein